MWQICIHDGCENNLSFSYIKRSKVSHLQSVPVCTKRTSPRYTSLTERALGRNVQSSINRPSHPATMDRGSWGEAKTGPWSIHPFISRIPMQQPRHRHPTPGPPHWPAPSQSAPAEMAREGRGGSHASNKSHHGHGNKPRRELLLKQALFRAVSYLVCHRLYQWDVMSWLWLYAHHIWFKYVFMSGENKSIGFKPATCSAPG